LESYTVHCDFSLLLVVIYFKAETCKIPWLHVIQPKTLSGLSSATRKSQTGWKEFVEIKRIMKSAGSDLLSSSAKDTAGI